MDCKTPLDKYPYIEKLVQDYKHYDFMMRLAFAKGEPVILEWIKDTFEVVKNES